MLDTEAAWIGQTLRDLPSAAFPVLNVGSSTDEFRRVDQPHIQELVLEPLLAMGRDVVHVDLKTGVGVDIALDFTKTDARERLARVGARTVLCSNLLEHLSVDPEAAIRQLASLVPHQGYLILTGPTMYYYHPDPIDNGYRPAASEVAAQLRRQRLTVLDARQVRSRRLAAYYYNDTGRDPFRFIVRHFLVARKGWLGYLTHSLHRASAFCILARRDAEN